MKIQRSYKSALDSFNPLSEFRNPQSIISDFALPELAAGRIPTFHFRMPSAPGPLLLAYYFRHHKTPIFLIGSIGKHLLPIQVLSLHVFAKGIR